MQLQVVKDYYGKLLKSSKDLKTSACCDGATIPSHVRPLLDNVHPEVVSKYYGCGLVAPADLLGGAFLISVQDRAGTPTSWPNWLDLPARSLGSI
jgi:arsenite methyltransferase